MRHVGIVVKSIEQSTAFYENLGFVVEKESNEESAQLAKVLGFEIVALRTVKLHLSYNELSMWREGGFRLELIEYSNPTSILQRENNNVVGKLHLCITVKDINKALLSISSKFDLPLVQSEVHNGVAMAYIVDPNGVAIELIQKL